MEGILSNVVDGYIGERSVCHETKGIFRKERMLLMNRLKLKVSSLTPKTKDKPKTGRYKGAY